MKHFLLSMLVLLLGVSHTPAQNRVPIKHGVLQSDLNVGGFQLTNVAGIKGANGEPLNLGSTVFRDSTNIAAPQFGDIGLLSITNSFSMSGDVLGDYVWTGTLYTNNSGNVRNPTIERSNGVYEIWWNNPRTRFYFADTNEGPVSLISGPHWQWDNGANVDVSIVFNPVSAQMDSLLLNGRRHTSIVTPQQLTITSNGVLAAAQFGWQTADATAAASMTNYADLSDNVNASTNNAQPALQAALNKGGWVRLMKPGVYLNTPALQIKSNTRLTLGPGVTLKRANDNALLFTYSTGVTGGFNNASNIVIEGGTWDSGYDISPVNATVIGIGHARNVVIRDATFVGNPGSWHSVELNGVQDATVKNCKFFSTSSSEALQLDSMINSGVWPWPGPYDNTPCDNIKIQNCWFEGNVDSIGTHSAASDFHRRIEISGCVFTNFTSVAIKPLKWSHVSVKDNVVVRGYRFIDCDVNGNGGATWQDWSITGNRIEDLNIGAAGQGRALKLKYITNGIIAMNRVENIARHAIGLDSPSDNWLITGNIVRRAGVSGTGRAMWLYGACNVTVTGNDFLGAADYSVYLGGDAGGGGYSTNCTFIGNNFANPIFLGYASNCLVQSSGSVTASGSAGNDSVVVLGRDGMTSTYKFGASGSATVNVTMTGTNTAAYYVGNAGGMTFPPLITNATSREYDIRDFGAVSDGVVGNDHLAFQTALDTAYTNGGGIVYIPKGQFFLTNTTYWPSLLSEGHQSLLVIRTNNITIRGEGVQSVIKVFAGGAGTMNLFGCGDGGSWLGANNIVFENFVIDGNYPNAPYLYDCTQLYGMGRVVFKGIHFINLPSDAVDVISPHTVVQNCVSSNVVGSFVQVSSSASFQGFAHVSDCQIFDTGQTPTAGALDTGDQATIFAERVTGKGTNFNFLTGFHGGALFVSQGNFVFGTNGNITNVTCSSTATTSFEDCSFNSLVSAPNSTFILCSNTINLVRCRNSNKRLVSIITASTVGSLIDGCYIGGQESVLLQGSGHRVTGNHFAAGAGVALRTSGSNPTHNSIFSDNLLYGCGLYLENGGTNNLVSDNVGYFHASIRINSGTHNTVRGNLLAPFDSTANQLGISAANNVFENNRVGRVMFQPGGTGNVIRNNLWNDLNFVSGAGYGTYLNNTLEGNRLTSFAAANGNSLNFYSVSNNATIATVAAGMTNGTHWIGTMSNSLWSVYMSNNVVTATNLWSH